MSSACRCESALPGILARTSSPDSWSILHALDRPFRKAALHRSVAGYPGRRRRAARWPPLRPLLRVEPTPGISDSVHYLYRADSAAQIGAPDDDFESSRIEWVPLEALPGLIVRGEITSGTTLAASLHDHSGLIRLPPVGPTIEVAMRVCLA